MNKLFSWATNPTHSNKWDRMALTKQGAYIVAWVTVNEENVFTSSVLTHIAVDKGVVSQAFSSLENAKTFADQELKRQGF